VAESLTRRAESQTRTRRALLEAAAQVFRRRGFAPATLREIAQEAGFSTGAIYANFASKAELAVAVLDELLNATQYDIFAAVDAGMPLETQLQQGVERLAQDLSGSASLFRLELECLLAANEDAELGERLRRRAAAAQDRLAATTQERLSAVGYAATIPVQDLAGMLIEVVNGVALGHVLNSHRGDPESLRRVLLPMYLTYTAPLTNRPGE
jgi:AcrR family transcriptional regulator